MSIFSKILIGTVCLILCGILTIAYLWHVPAEERQFIQAVQEHFKENAVAVSDHEKIIYLSKIVDIEWDKVCSVANDAYFDSEGVSRKQKFLGTNYEQSKVELPDIHSFKYNWGLVFIEKEIPVKILEFHKWTSISLVL